MAGNRLRQTTVELRDAFGECLVEIGNENNRVVFLDADLHTSTKATMFRDAFPSRFYQIGIAEQNMFGVASGLALEGYIPIASTFAAFAARRALDQIAISICYPGLDVKIPGSYAGVPTSRAGASHNCIEDTAIMSSIPNLKVADPGTPEELKAVMRASIREKGPVYYRVARFSTPELFEPNHVFDWGTGQVIQDGNDVAIFSTGIMVHKAIEAAEILAREGVSAAVVHLASIKPIDEDLISRILAQTECGVTVENSNIRGGFAAAVSLAMAKRYPVPLEHIGVADVFVESGGTEQLFTHLHMQPTDIAAAARHAVHRKREPANAQ